MPELSGMIQEFLEGSIKSIGGKQPVIQSKTITENGTYNSPSGVDGFNPVVVNVPSQEPNIQERVFASNGTFEPPEGVDGYAPVIIDVPIKEEITLNATTNGTYTPSEWRVYNNVIVNVPLPQNAYLLKSVTNLPQAIASFNDGEEMVMPSLKIAIEPQQEGSGDPSPENIRPFSGWNEVNVTRCGKNLYGGIDFANSVKDASPSGTIDTTNKTVTYTYGTGDKTTIYDNFKPNIAYTFLFKVADCDGQNFSMRIVYTDGTTEGIEILPSDIGKYVRKVSNPNKTVSKLAVMWYQTILVKLYYDECGIFEGNIQITDFEPYNGQTYTIDLDGTCYGGDVDVINGIVTPAPYYASYNGETLTGEWISDRDKYEVGTTPTIGAQVVNIGASGTPVSILPTAVKSLLGSNNVWADTGNITDAEYFSKGI